MALAEASMGRRLDLCAGLPHIHIVQTVVETDTFTAAAKRNSLTDEEVVEIAAAIAADPLGGDIVQGTGGCRKVRHAGRGKGKSGGYRTIHYYGGGDIPVFLITVYGKGRKETLSAAEKAAMLRLVKILASTY